MPTKEEEAVALVQTHYKVETGLTHVFRIIGDGAAEAMPGEPIKLLEVKDFVAWELYEKHPEAVAAECHKLHFLQMACEKLCKAHLIQRGTPPRDLQGSHGYIANPLPVVIREQMRRMSLL